MAPKPKKELTASEKATLKKLMAGKGALANGKLSMDQQLQLQGLKKKAKVNLDKPKPGDVAILRQRIAKDQFEGARAADKKSAPKKNASVRSRGPKAGTSTVSKVVKRAKTVAREVRDIPTAVGGIKDVLTNKGKTTPKGGTVNQLKSSIKNVASQVKETAKAAATGKKGRPAQKYQTSRDKVPATFWTQPKRK